MKEGRLYRKYMKIVTVDLKSTVLPLHFLSDRNPTGTGRRRHWDSHDNIRGHEDMIKKRRPSAMLSHVHQKCRLHLTTYLAENRAHHQLRQRKIDYNC